METVKNLSRRSFIMIMLFMSILLLACDLSYPLIFNMLAENAASYAGEGSSAVVMHAILNVGRNFRLIGISVISGVLFTTGFLTWLVIRISMSSVMGKGLEEQKKLVVKAPKKEAAPVVNKQEKTDNDRRMYLHLFSVLQREGRLMDFFNENLELYEDAQIGAAVRSIQENCKKTIDKYLKPVSVMDQEEGDEVVVEGNFDPDSIKLIGNVSGEPPFKGVLRHRGWKASKPELPKLAASRDSKLIAPAEVEIL